MYKFNYYHPGYSEIVHIPEHFTDRAGGCTKSYVLYPYGPWNLTDYPHGITIETCLN